MDFYSTKNIKYFLLLLIMFSIPSFGKNFKELFVIYEPIEDSTLIEKSINQAFNTMIYRLSGNSSPSNIWRIINAGNTRKDFITSYSVKNINERSYLEVNFDKNLLIEKFKDLEIPIVGNSRPVILFLIKIDSGNSAPYFVIMEKDNNHINELIRNSINKYSDSRGIFLELPELDLYDKINLFNYEKLIDSKDYISSKHKYDTLITLDLIKIGLDNWSVSGDLDVKYNAKDFSRDFINDFDELIENIIDKILKKNLIDISEETSIKITINNIKNVEYYRTSRSVMESLVGVKNLEIEKFEVDNISYKVNIYGDFDSVQKQISVNNSFVILESSFNERYLHLAYKQ